MSLSKLRLLVIMALIWIPLGAMAQCVDQRILSSKPLEFGAVTYSDPFVIQRYTNQLVHQARVVVEVMMQDKVRSRSLNGLNIPYRINLIHGDTSVNSQLITLSNESQRVVLEFKLEPSLYPHQLRVDFDQYNPVTEPSTYHIEHVDLVPNYKVMVETVSQVNIEGLSINLDPSMQVQTNKRIWFSWHTNSTDSAVCGWELDLLKLEDHSPILRPNTSHITSSAVNWANATRFAIGPSEGNGPVSTSVLIAEGSGHYVWRVRAVGSTVVGDRYETRYSPFSHIDNPKICHFAQDSTPKDGSAARRAYAFFYFDDPDKRTNNIYQRLFKEDNSLKEKATYADGLNQVKQTLVSIPSEQTIILEQKLVDRQGRVAWTSLPVPLFMSSLDTSFRYQRKAITVKDSAGVLYRERHFDQSSTLRSPADAELLNPTYYTGQNGIASDQGQPFQRTIFSNDKTNRVVEQGMPGGVLGIKDPSQSHTTRTIYGSATEGELVRWFGVDAPMSENVEKIITVDPNGTTTTTYKTSDGKVLATSINLSSPGDTALLPIAESTIPDTTYDRIKSGIPSAAGISTTKPLLFNTRSPLILGYGNLPDLSSDGCAVTRLGCEYDLVVKLKREDGNRFGTNASVNSRFVGGLGVIAPDTVGWKINPDDSSEIRIVYHHFLSLNTYGFNLPRLVLPAGNYILTRSIVPTDRSRMVTSVGEKLGRQTRPITKLIHKWLSRVKQPCDLVAFRTKVAGLIGAIDSLHALNDDPARDSILYIRYLVPEALGEDSLKGTYFHYVKQIVTSLENVTIETECCPIFNVPLALSVTFAGPATVRDYNHNNVIEIDPLAVGTCANLEYQYDFEGFAYKYFGQCVPATKNTTYEPSGIKGWASFSSAKKDSMKHVYNTYLRPFMPGYQTTGTFNLMIYKMLTDTYAPDGGIPKVQYDSAYLFNCWQTQLSIIKRQVGGCPNEMNIQFNVNSNRSVSNGVDDNQGGNGAVHDDLINNNIKQDFFSWLFGGSRSRRNIANDVRNAQTSAGISSSDQPLLGSVNTNVSYNLITEFMNCAGFRFQKILTQYDSRPDTGDYDVAHNYVSPSTWYRPLTGFTYDTMLSTAMPISTIDTNYVKSLAKYRPYPLFYVGRKNSQGWKAVFPGVRHPVWAYKYFHFPQDSLKETEVRTCFADPNKYFDVTTQTYKNLCPSTPEKPDSLCYFCNVGHVICTRTRLDWSSDERYSFFKIFDSFGTGGQGGGTRSDGLDTLDFFSPFAFKYDPDNTIRDSLINWTDTLGVVTMGQYGTLVGDTFRPAPGAPRLLTRAEDEIRKANIEVVTRIEDRRDIYRAILLTNLVDKGYVIDSCTDQTCPNHITMQEVNIILDHVMREAKSRGQVTTFSIDCKSCRSFTTPATQPGHVDKKGMAIKTSSIELGTGRCGDTTYPSTYLHYRRVADPIFFDKDTTQQLMAPVFDPDSNRMLVKPIWYVLNNRLNCEKVKRKQVTQMDMHFEVPPTAGGDTLLACRDTNFVLTPDCPTFINNLGGQAASNFNNPPMPTQDTRVRLEMTLNRKKLHHISRKYQRP